MDIQITPKKLSGAVTPPASKSQAHRAILASMLAGSHRLDPRLSWSEDLRATERCVTALRGRAPAAADGLPLLDCGESGSTLRFLLPLSLVLRGGGHFTGRGRLMERPQQPYFDLFDEKGIAYEKADHVLTVRGTLTPGVYALPGNVSSQFVTGLLFALPLLPGDSRIHITSPLESSAYVDMTLQVLEQAGIRVDHQGYTEFQIPGNQRFCAGEITLEADWSQAGFWYAANFLENPIRILDMTPASAQGDKVVTELYWQLARPGDAEINVSGCPDLLPPLAVMAAVRSGTTRFTNAARLRMKESDRLSTTAALLTALGGRAEEGPDCLTVHGGPLSGGTVDSANDHRIAMAAAIAATACTGPVTVRGAECVKKSYPDFWEVYQSLGGDIHVL